MKPKQPTSLQQECYYSSKGVIEWENLLWLHAPLGWVSLSKEPLSGECRTRQTLLKFSDNAMAM